MTKAINDRYGKPAPTMTVTEIRRRPGQLSKLTECRGAVAISRNGEIITVALSLDVFVSLLFGIKKPKHSKRRTSSKLKRGNQ